MARPIIDRENSKQEVTIGVYENRKGEPLLTVGGAVIASLPDIAPEIIRQYRDYVSELNAKHLEPFQA